MIEAQQIADAIAETHKSMLRAGAAMDSASKELERRYRRIKRLEAVIEEIKEIARDNYDGPEDKTLGGILALCENGLL